MRLQESQAWTMRIAGAVELRWVKQRPTLLPLKPVKLTACAKERPALKLRTLASLAVNLQKEMLLSAPVVRMEVTTSREDLPEPQEMMDLEMLRDSRREAFQPSQEVVQTEERPAAWAAVWAELEDPAARKMLVSDSAAQIKTEVAVVVVIAAATVVAEEVESVAVVAAAWEDLDAVTMLEAAAEISAASEPVMLLASE